MAKHEDCTIVWLCVHQLEFDAARAILGEDQGSISDPEEDASYFCAKVGESSVVVAGPVAEEDAGKSPAKIFQSIICKFPCIRFGLAIGTGAVEAGSEISAGDVVVDRTAASSLPPKLISAIDDMELLPSARAQEIRVHHGLIGATDALCIEMEPAALPQNLPALNIRGIFGEVDAYNVKSQEIAAHAAVSVGRDFVQSITASETQLLPLVTEMVSQRLVSKMITYREAEDSEEDILRQLEYFSEMMAFYHSVWGRRDWILGVVAHHLKMRPSECEVPNPLGWLRGTFNVCIPITDKRLHRRIILRLPLPYRVGEKFRPGNADEKLRCEAATYSWLRQNCPSVPIPTLYGFGLSTGQQFTSIEYLPFFKRWYYSVRNRVLSWWTRQIPSPYVRHQSRSKVPHFESGYMLLECIEPEEGQMLSNTWTLEKHDEEKRSNLYRHLSRILLALARIPVMRIGAFRLDDDGRLSLSNRPLSTDIAVMENNRVPLDMPRNMTYSRADTYLLDVLAIHDARLVHQQNGVTSMSDFIYQTTTFSAARASIFKILSPRLNTGPFILTFDDLHQSNIFVDKDWNITRVMDLEFAFAAPIQSVQLPYWTVADTVDGIDQAEYDREQRKFLQILISEEAKLENPTSYTLSSIMEEGWESGAYFVYLAAGTTAGFCHIFAEHILPVLHISDEFISDRATFLYKLWHPRRADILSARLKDKLRYDHELAGKFF